MALTSSSDFSAALAARSSSRGERGSTSSGGSGCSGNRGGPSGSLQLANNMLKEGKQKILWNYNSNSDCFK